MLTYEQISTYTEDDSGKWKNTFRISDSKDGLFADSISSAVFTGSGLDDMSSGGTYTDVDPREYRIVIDGVVGLANTFQWRNQTDGAWTTDVVITGAAQTLEDGITVTFGAISGQNYGDYWDFSVIGTANIFEVGDISRELQLKSGKFIMSELDFTINTAQIRSDENRLKYLDALQFVKDAKDTTKLRYVAYYTDRISEAITVTNQKFAGVIIPELNWTDLNIYDLEWAEVLDVVREWDLTCKPLFDKVMDGILHKDVNDKIEKEWNGTYWADDTTWRDANVEDRKGHYELTTSFGLLLESHFMQLVNANILLKRLTDITAQLLTNKNGETYTINWTKGEIDGYFRPTRWSHLKPVAQLALEYTQDVAYMTAFKFHSIDGSITIPYTFPEDDTKNKLKLGVYKDESGGDVTDEVSPFISYSTVKKYEKYLIGSAVPAGGNTLNDLTSKGSFTATSTKTFTIKIDSTGGTDTFAWMSSLGGGWHLLNSITGEDQSLENGVSIKFDAITGHVLNDSWTITISLTNEISPTGGIDDIEQILWSENSKVKTFTDFLYFMATNFGVFVEMSFTSSTEITIKFVGRQDFLSGNVYIKDFIDSKGKMAPNETEKSESYYGIASQFAMEGKDLMWQKLSGDKHALLCTDRRGRPLQFMESARYTNELKEGIELLCTLAPTIFLTSSYYNYDYFNLCIPYNMRMYVDSVLSSTQYLNYNSYNTHNAIYMKVEPYGSEGGEPTSAYWTNAGIWNVQGKDYEKMADYLNELHILEDAYYESELSLECNHLNNFSASSLGTNPHWKNLTLGSKFPYDSLEYIVTKIVFHEKDKETSITLQNSERFTFADASSYSAVTPSRIDILKPNSNDVEIKTCDGTIIKNNIVTINDDGTIKDGISYSKNLRKLYGMALELGVDTEELAITIVNGEHYSEDWSTIEGITGTTGTVGQKIYLRKTDAIGVAAGNLSIYPILQKTGDYPFIEDLNACIGHFVTESVIKLNFDEQWAIK